MIATSIDLEDYDSLRLCLEERPVAASAEPTDAEVRAYYDAHLPPGSPPLSEIRAHVVAAIQAEVRPPTSEDDPLSARAEASSLHLLVSQQDDLELVSEQADVSRFRSHHAQRWFCAAEGEAELSRLAQVVAAGPTGPRRRKLFAPDDVRVALVEALERAAEVLKLADGDGRRFRLQPFRRSVPLDEQVAVLASAGLELRPGAARADLLLNYTEEELAAVPWRRLMHEFVERCDGVGSIWLKGVEPEPGCYAGLARAVCTICRGRLPLGDVRSSYEPAADQHELSFTLDDQPHQFRPTSDRHWLDRELLTVLGRLLRRRGGYRLYTLRFDADHDPIEDMLLLCLDRSDALRLVAAGVPLEAIG